VKNPKELFTLNHERTFQSVKIREDGFPECVPPLEITIFCDGSDDENFTIHSKKDNPVEIRHGSKRGLKYALESLSKMFTKDHSLPLGIVEDGPAFPMRGIIEGFYGVPWSHQDRLDAIVFCEENRLNTYMYAPKDDPFHRELWRVPYPAHEFKELTELIDEANRRMVDFYFSISPGKDFNFAEEADFEALFQKIDAVVARGVRHFCLLLDDIDYALHGADKEMFATPGKAHSHISNRLFKHLKKCIDNPVIVMCPTEYWQIKDSPYRSDLKHHLDSEIKVFWTGYNTIAEYIRNEDGPLVREQFGHDLVLWDNYPVNDVAPDLLFLGPLRNRGKNLPISHVGMVSNPMNQWELSKIALFTMAEYMWNPSAYDEKRAHENALKAFCKGDNHLYQALTTLVRHFEFSLLNYNPNPSWTKRIEALDFKALKPVMMDLRRAMVALEHFDNPAFHREFTPWKIRIQWEMELFDALVENKDQEISILIDALNNLKASTGSNIPLKLAKKTNRYAGPLDQKLTKIVEGRIQYGQDRFDTTR